MCTIRNKFDADDIDDGTDDAVGDEIIAKTQNRKTKYLVNFCANKDNFEFIYENSVCSFIQHKNITI